MVDDRTDTPGAAADGARPGDQEGLARLAEEVRLLVELVVEHALPWLEELMAAGHGRWAHEQHERTPDPGDGAAADASGCAWCPLCSVVAVAKGERPEFVMRIFEQAAQVLALLRAVLADRWQPDDGVHMPGFRPAPRADAESSRVQHITVRRPDGWQTGR